MDKVTQQNAANSEENASSSEELGAQSGFLRDLVGDLAALVTGEAYTTSTSRSMQTGTTKQLKPTLNNRPQVNPKRTTTKALASPANVHKEKPEDIIPMDNDDFEDF